MIVYSLIDISGGAYSDWVYGTDAYAVPSGYEAYAFTGVVSARVILNCEAVTTSSDLISTIVSVLLSVVFVKIAVE